MSGFEIHRPEAPDSGRPCVIVVRECLDGDTSRNLYRDVRAQLDAGCRAWEVDLREMVYCNSPTLGVWIMLHSTVSNRGGKIQFRVNAGSDLDRLFSAMKLHHVLKVVR